MTMAIVVWSWTQRSVAVRVVAVMVAKVAVMIVVCGGCGGNDGDGRDFGDGAAPRWTLWY